MTIRIHFVQRLCHSLYKIVETTLLLQNPLAAADIHSENEPLFLPAASAQVNVSLSAKGNHWGLLTSEVTWVYLKAAD